MTRFTLLFAALFCTLTSSAQTTPVPDPVFESKLISLGIDTNGMTGDILNSDAAGVINLNVTDSGISDLSGIEAFVDLVMLDVDTNLITSLDLSFNPQLEILDCQNNLLSSLNISGNPLLTILACNENQLTTLDVSSNTALNSFSAQRNLLTDLDFTSNPNLFQIVAHENELTNITFHPNPSSLEIVWIYENQLTSIDLTFAPILATLRFEMNSLTFLDLRNGNNTNINTMDARDNPDLELICVDNVAFSETAPNWNKDSTASYSKTCTLSNDEVASSAFALFPNPVQDRLEIILSSGQDLRTAEIFNVLGKKVLAGSSRNLDVSGLANGMYFIRIETGSGQVATRRFIKN